MIHSSSDALREARPGPAVWHLPRWKPSAGASRGQSPGGVRPPLALGLQGGGAHGAFTWGVLDALLEDPGIPLCAISGASAGALNAVLLASGLAEGGARPGLAGPTAREAARAALERFWLALASESPFERHGSWLLQGDPETPRLSPVAWWLFDWTARFTPQQLNPRGLNPLRDLLATQVDFDRLRAQAPLPLFLAATDVGSAQLRVFREREVTVEMLLASTCLPRLHAPVEIDGRAWWDGGYSANPPIDPLVFDLPPPGPEGRDLLLVTLSPAGAPSVPDSTRSIAQRQMEMAFSVPLLTELRWLERLRAGTDRAGLHRLPWMSSPLERQMRGLRLHRIGIDDPTEDSAAPPSPEAALIASRAHVSSLKEAGRAAALDWLRPGRRAPRQAPTPPVAQRQSG